MTASQDKSVTDRVSQWLSKHGYSLEFTAAHALTMAQWKPSMGVGVRGRDKDDPYRDVDVLGSRCILSKAGVGTGKCVAFLLVECKYIPANNPWVLLGKHDVHEPRQIPQYVPRAVTKPETATLANTPILFEVGSTVRPDSHRIVSHGIVRANLKKGDTGQPAEGNEREKQDGKDEQRDRAFETVSKVVDLAWSLVDEARQWDTHSRAAKEVFVVPMIVVRGPLVRVAFDPATKQSIPEEVDFGTVLVNQPPESTLVHIVKDSSLPQYLESLTAEIERWGESLLNPPKLRKRYSRRKVKTRI